MKFIKISYKFEKNAIKKYETPYSQNYISCILNQWIIESFNIFVFDSLEFWETISNSAIIYFKSGIKIS